MHLNRIKPVFEKRGVNKESSIVIETDEPAGSEIISDTRDEHNHDIDVQPSTSYQSNEKGNNEIYLNDRPQRKRRRPLGLRSGLICNRCEDLFMLLFLWGLSTLVEAV